MLVEQRLANDKKSTAVAYVLWFFLGGLGAHRFYLGRTGSAVGMLVLTIVGWLTIVLYIGIILLLAVVVWLIVDAFLIPGILEEDTKAKRSQISNEVAVMAGRTA